MPKLTLKYSSALEIAKKLKIVQVDNQERLYCELNQVGFFWNPEIKIWVRSQEPADPPTDLIRIRVWADSKKVTRAAIQIKSVLEQSGFEFIEQSEAYVCRPPKQLESRIYLTFKQRN